MFIRDRIRRFDRLDPAAWSKTKRVHLVSSLVASVLAGKDAAIDTGDGAGMNLMDIRKGDWAPAALAATAPDPAAKLPPVRPGSTPVPYHPPPLPTDLPVCTSVAAVHIT